MISAGARRTFSSIDVLAAGLERPLEDQVLDEVRDDAVLAFGGDDDQPFGAGLGRLGGHQLDAGRVDDRQQLFRHRLGGGQKPRPQTGCRNHRVCGIGTSDRVIVHTLTLARLNLQGRLRRFAVLQAVIVDGVARDESRTASRDPVGPPRVGAAAARCRGRGALRAPACVVERRRHGLRLCAGRLGARLDRADRFAAAAGVRVLLPVARNDAAAPRCRCGGASTTPASSSRRGSACASPPSHGCPPPRSPAATWSWCRRWRSTAAGVRLGRGAGFYDRSLPLADPAARLVAVVRDDELVDRLPAEPHDVRMTHALTPARRGRADAVNSQQFASTSAIARFSLADTHS